MDWLKPAILSTLISSAILFLFYLYLYFRLDQKKTFTYWIVGWSFYSLRFVFNYFDVAFTSGNNIYLEISIIFSLLSALFLFQGTYHLFYQKASKGAYVITSLLLIWSFIVFIQFDNYLYIIHPLYVFYGIVFIYSGILFLNKAKPRTFESTLVGVLFILWGFHKFDYPYLIEIKNIAPIGYTVSAVFGILIAFSIGLYFIEQTSRKLRKNEKALQQTNDEIKIHNERLISLLNLSKLNTHSIEELVTEALNEAIKLTRSKIGYIYYYDEEKKLFTLNAWSDSTMNECKIVDKQTVYSLEKTGCWGEAVRQKKPILMNDFAAPNQYKRGLPEGHVSLKKFLSVPVFDDNKIVAVVGVANKESDYDNADINQLTLLMDNVWRISEKIRLIKDLETALDKAKESEKLKTAFLQNLSHEIRTPMNGIVGFADILKKNDLSKDKFDLYLDIVVSSSNQLLSVVNDIIAISALETRQEKIHTEKISLKQSIHDVLETQIEIAREKGLKLQMSNGIGNISDIVLTDGPKLKQILTNLITNAIKFTKEGSVDVSYNADNEWIYFKVKDTGIGIDQTLHQAIFERFRQADSTPNRKYGGSGLGLSISRGLVELLGGEIRVESEPGKGAAFLFTIPYKPAEKKKMNNQPQKLEQTGLEKILVAEDELVNYMLLEELINNSGIPLLHAENGEEAIELFKQNPDITVILMDIKMPKMDGYTAAKKIKEINSDVTIIAQTSYALDVEIEKYRDAFDGYLTKPIDEQDLFELLNKTAVTVKSSN